MRRFDYITVGQIIEKLKKRGVSISRATFYNLERQDVFPSTRTSGKWRVYTEVEAKAVIRSILENYGIIEPGEEFEV